MNNNFFQIESIINKIFDNNIILLSSIDELFELKMPNLEFICLDKKQLLERLVFFMSINNQYTKR